MVPAPPHNAPEPPGAVWYVAYGSNHHGPRLQRYLDRAPVTRPPLDRRATRLPHRLFFADHSTSWGGGGAFVDPTVDPGAGTLATAWLLSEVQFLSVLAQENGRQALDGPAIDLHALAPGQRQPLVSGRYGLVLGCASPDDRPAVTFTTPTSPLPPPTAPSAAYVDVIVAGLVDGHGLSDAEARAYVVARIDPAVRG